MGVSVPTELERRAAEMPCPGQDCEQGVILGYRLILDQPCPLCQGTGRFWPLSRECPGDGPFRDSDGHLMHKGCLLCHGSGRVPDCTLEKVLPLIYSLEKASSAEWLGYPVETYTGLWAAQHKWYDKGDPKTMTYYEQTPLEAALAALLASVEAKTHGK